MPMKHRLIYRQPWDASRADRGHGQGVIADGVLWAWVEMAPRRASVEDDWAVSNRYGRHCAARASFTW